MRDINGWVVSRPLTNTRDINGWGVSQSFVFVRRTFFIKGDE